MTLSIKLLSMGTVDVPGPEVYWMSRWNEWIPLTLQIALIRGDGICALVNTGPPEDLESMNRHWIENMGDHNRLERRDGEFVIDALRACDVEPRDVTHIIVTPLEGYTVSNVDRFPSAEICLSKRGWVHFHTTHKHPHHNRAGAIPENILAYLTTDGWPRVRLLDDEEIICPGIRTWWAGTHNRASLVVEVDTTVGVAAISDIYLYLENVTEDHPLGICESLDEAVIAYNRVRSKASHIVPLTDPKNLDRFPGGEIP